MDTEEPERPASGQMATQVIDGRVHMTKIPGAHDLPESWLKQNAELKVLRGVVVAQDEKAAQKDREIGELKWSLAQFKKTNIQISSDKEKSQIDLTSVEKENDELKKSVAALRQKYFQCQAKTREVEKEREECNKINALLQKEMDKSRKDVNDLQYTIEKLDLRIQEARRRNDSLEAELDILLKERQILYQKLFRAQGAEWTWANNKGDSKRSSTQASTPNSRPPTAEGLASLEKQLLCGEEESPTPMKSSPHASLEVGYDVKSTRTDESSPDLNAIITARLNALEKVDSPAAPRTDPVLATVESSLKIVSTPAATQTNTVLAPLEEVPCSLHGLAMTRSGESSSVSPQSQQPVGLEISPPVSASVSTPVTSPSAIDKLFEILKLKNLSGLDSLPSPVLDSEGSAGTAWVVQPTPLLEKIIQPLRPRRGIAIHTTTVPDLEQSIGHRQESNANSPASPSRWSYAPIPETAKSQRLAQQYADFTQWILSSSHALRVQEGGRDGVGACELPSRQLQTESSALQIRQPFESHGTMAVTRAELPFGETLILQTARAVDSTMILQLLVMLICLVICYAYNEGQRQFWMRANNGTRKLVVGWRDEQWSGVIWLAKLLFTLENWARLDRAKMA